MIEKRHLVGVGLAVLALFAGPAAGSAGALSTVGYDPFDDALLATGDPGRNVITLSAPLMLAAADEITITDATGVALGAGLPGGMCTLNGKTATCRGTIVDPIAAVEVDGGDELDQITSLSDFGSTSIALRGGSGPDLILGGPAGESIDGEGGADELHGGTGGDALSLDATDAVSYDDDDRAAGVLLGGPHGLPDGDTFTGYPGTIVGSDFADELIGNEQATAIDGGAGDDMVDGGLGDDALSGGGGADTLRYESGRAAGVVVDAAAGSFPDGEDAPAGFERLRGTGLADMLTAGGTLTWLEGRGGNDRLTGAAGAETLLGEAGDDTLLGGAGGDTITGGETGETAGDTVSYDEPAHSAGTGSPINLASSAPGDGDTGELVAEVENVTGSPGPDGIIGDGAANTILGLAGADTIAGGAGDDLIVPGAGSDEPSGGDGGETNGDTVSYDDGAPRPAPVRVDIGADAADDGDLGESATGFENLIGTAGDDELEGSPTANRIQGLGGDDLIRPGLGDDDPDGGANGAGGDTISYADAARTAGVTVNIGSDSGDDGDAGEVARNFENIVGSAVQNGTDAIDDTLQGSNGANRIDGGLGDDRISGLAGDDTLDGGPGDADLVFPGGGGDGQVKGGEGARDRIDYSDQAGPVTVDLESANADGTPADVAAGEQAVGFEQVTGTNAGDSLAGTTVANRLDGRDGPDVLFGRAGNDTLLGGNGDDTVQGGAGTDNATGDSGAGNDTLDYDDGRTTRVEVDLAGGDTVDGGENLANFEHLVGGGGDDLLIAISGGGHSVSGRDGDDEIRLGGGAGNTATGNGHGAGGDTLSLAGAGAVIDLGPGPDSIGGVPVGVATIENVVGTDAADTLTGDDGANALAGGAGDDTIRGGGGADALAGGDGDDTVAYDDGRATPVTVDLDPGLDPVDGGEDPLGFERLQGSAADDTLRGTAHADSIHGGDGNDAIDGEGGDDALTGAAGGDKLAGGDGADVLRGDEGDDELTPGAGADAVVDGGSGRDRVRYDEPGRAGGVTVDLGAPGPDGGTGDGAEVATAIEDATGTDAADAITGSGDANALAGGGGDDTIAGGDGADALTGGNGADELRGGPGADDLAGDGGDDRVRGGPGADALHGGAGGADAVTYDERSEPVTATMDGAANDGAEGEADEIDADVEQVEGGAGDDTLTGSGQADTLLGGGGADLLVGQAGTDTLLAGAGDDTVEARDNTADTVDCGDGAADRVDADGADTVANCEGTEIVRPVPDADGDGIEDDIDCDDGNATIHQGAPEIAGNGVDDDCKDGDAAPDRDGDGYDRDHECDDANPRIKPGAVEIVGNAVDENCDHIVAPYPIIQAGLAYLSAIDRNGRKLTELSASNLPTGAVVTLTCKSKQRRACPFSSKRRSYKRATKKDNLLPLFKRRRLPLATVLTVSLTAPDTIGKYFRFTVKRTGLTRKLTCRTPAGAAVPCVTG